MNFLCEYCGKPIIENLDGRYLTSCKHYPLEESNVRCPNFKGRASHEKLMQVESESKKFIQGIKKELKCTCCFGEETAADIGHFYECPLCDKENFNK